MPKLSPNTQAITSRFVLEKTELNDENYLSLNDTEHVFKPIQIDFNQLDQEWQYKSIGKNFALCKAVGFNKLSQSEIENLNILDATAGLGKDSFILAKMGAQVTLLERNQLLSQLLDQAITHCENLILKNKLHLIHTDAITYLDSNHQQNIENHDYDVIYLDPMFPEKTNSALVKKEMQILQTVVGNDLDSAQLLELALNRAKKRVVVKRPKGADYLASKKPSFAINGKTVRYDVYIGKRQ